MAADDKEEGEVEDGIEDGYNKMKLAENDPNVLIAQFQLLQQQLQNVLIQKESLNMNLMEIDRATEELEKSKEGSAYKITGAIMVKKSAEELKKDLAESKETLEVRVKSLEKTEKVLTDKLKELQEKLRKIIK